MKQLHNVIIAAACIASFALCSLFDASPVCYHESANFSSFLLFHFCHDNIFHLSLNLLVLASFKPRLSTAILAYLVATTAAIADACIIDNVRTCGLSAFLFAAIARRQVAWREKERALQVLYAILIGFLLPHINASVHLFSYLLALLAWTLFYRMRAYNTNI
jgi:hypothetical protein